MRLLVDKNVHFTLSEMKIVKCDLIRRERRSFPTEWDGTVLGDHNCSYTFL